VGVVYIAREKELAYGQFFLRNSFHVPSGSRDPLGFFFTAVLLSVVTVVSSYAIGNISIALVNSDGQLIGYRFARIIAHVKDLSGLFFVSFP
jgi:hypothetical protein